ncbi:MAG TPA: hypothetical protein VM940_02205 [Chthoniobacterales bacterium]|jgi:hypothetical protein|nr:hypothetical protein [Chthoniobacterales bacterium]
MKRYLACVLVLLAFVLNVCADQVPFAIVHGPKGAFTITAPKGWVIDNTAGQANGLPCVLFQKGQTWDKAEPLMYAKIASTSHEDAEEFARTAIEEMKKERGDYKVERVATGKTKGGETYFINEYSPSKQYARVERVAYVQMPKAVAYVVFSCEGQPAMRKHQRAITELLESFTAMTVKADDGR